MIVRRTALERLEELADELVGSGSAVSFTKEAIGTTRCEVWDRAGARVALIHAGTRTGATAIMIRHLPRLLGGAS